MYFYNSKKYFILLLGIDLPAIVIVSVNTASESFWSSQCEFHPILVTGLGH
jgi:hypothetical protein